ncbi:MAG: sensor histidine kinase [Gammaproteobacteria bacterium]|nr:sensor histidine kinase [Gammaproteobacteria bacterium]MDH5801935.1 sensor histidine kinase [Gammaproteobacteria bacterium]
MSAISTFVYWHERTQQIVTTQQILQGIANVKQRALSYRMQEEQRLVLHFSQMPVIRDPALVLLNPALSRVQRQQTGEILQKGLAPILHDASNVTYVTVMDAMMEQTVYSFPPGQHHSGPLSESLVLSYSPETEKVELKISAALSQHGSRVGTLVFSLRSEFLQQILYDLAGFGSSTQTYLLDSNNRIVAGAAQRDSNSQIVSQPYRELHQTETGARIYRNYHGDKVLGYSREISDIGMTLVAELNWDEVMQPLTQVAWWIISFTVLIVLLALAIGMVLARQITKPILAVANTAEKIAKGDLALRVEQANFEELHTLSGSFNHMADTLQATLQEKDLINRETESVNAKLLAATSAKNIFLANMSHELRTPLNAIIGYSELLREEAESNQLQGLVEDFGKIQSAGHHLLTLINDILDVAKIEEGKIELHYEEFLVPELVGSLESVTQLLVKQNNNTLIVSCAPELNLIQADVTRLKQALINLLSNAAKFTRDGTITLTVYKCLDADGEWAVFSVRDTGVGIDSDKLDRVFERFSQADSSTTKQFGGTGLGLTLAKQFVELMQGTLTVNSVAGFGSEFTISIPTTPLVTPKQNARG